MKGRPEYPGVDDLLDRLTAIYAELRGRKPTASQERVDAMGFLDFCKKVDRLAAAPEGIADENRIRRAVARWRDNSSIREKVQQVGGKPAV